MRNLPRLRLAGMLVLFCGFAVLLTVGAVVPLTLKVSRDLTERQSTEVLRGRAHDAGVQLARALYGEWFKLQQLAPLIANGESPDVLRSAFNTIKAVNPDCAWLGFADASGHVVVSSGGVLEGESVLQRPWFRTGIDRPFAGDKHEALLLARFFKAKAEEPLRLVDLSLPVRKDDGTLVGVVAMHIDWYWIRDFLRAFGREDGSDLLLVSREGDVLVGPQTVEGKRMTLHSMQAAAQGVGVSEAEVWPDGERYLVSVVPGVTYRDLPSFGWSIVARQSSTLALAPAHEATQRILPVLLGVSVGLLVLAFMFGRMLGTPIARLALAAGEMARGRFSAPVPDERRYQEAAVLSAGLARLQSTVAAEAREVATFTSITKGSVAA